MTDSPKPLPCRTGDDTTIAALVTACAREAPLRRALGGADNELMATLYESWAEALLDLLDARVVKCEGALPEKRRGTR